MRLHVCKLVCMYGIYGSVYLHYLLRELTVMVPNLYLLPESL